MDGIRKCNSPTLEKGIKSAGRETGQKFCLYRFCWASLSHVSRAIAYAWTLICRDKFAWSWTQQVYQLKLFFLSFIGGTSWKDTEQATSLKFICAFAYFKHEENVFIQTEKRILVYLKDFMTIFVTLCYKLTWKVNVRFMRILLWRQKSIESMKLRVSWWMLRGRITPECRWRALKFTNEDGIFYLFSRFWIRQEIFCGIHGHRFKRHVSLCLVGIRQTCWSSALCKPWVLS